MEYGCRVKIKFFKEINRLIFKYSKEIMDFIYKQWNSS